MWIKWAVLSVVLVASVFAVGDDYLQIPLAMISAYRAFGLYLHFGPRVRLPFRRPRSARPVAHGPIFHPVSDRAISRQAIGSERLLTSDPTSRLA